MKRIWKHPEEPQNAKRYWRSVSELERREDFLKTLGQEFPAGDTLSEEERESGRREFLKIMGASVGMMGLASCRRPLTTIQPYTQHVEWMIPGKPLLYATTMPRSGGSTPLVVTTHEGRPTHVTGNPLHPLGGGVDSFAQASVLDLYDPERSQKPLGAGKELSWAKANDLLAAAVAEAKKTSGASLGVIAGATTSPTYLRLLDELKAALPQVKLFQYEAVGGEGMNAANKDVLGAGVKPFIKLGSAKRILALDCDFLGLDPVSGEPISAFTKHRAKDSKASEADMNRLYVLENRYTLTGGMADHRKPLAASLIPLAAAVIAAQLGDASAKALADTAPDSLKGWLTPAVNDLIDNKGKALVVAGSRYGAEVHALVASINNALGAFGSTIELLQAAPAPEMGGFAELHAAVSSGQLKTLVSLTPSNLYYDAPDAQGFAKLITEKGVNLVQVGMLKNKTARHAALHIPAAHYLESWGDVRAADGTYSIVQPMIAPLYDGASKIEVLLALLGRKKLGPAEAPADGAAPAEDAAYVAVRDTFAAVADGLDENKWNLTLRDGFLKGSAYGKSGATPNLAAAAALAGKAKAAAPSDDALEIVLTPDAGVFDGRYTNNAWLQEAPDPVTKLTWDNAAWIGSVTFRRLGLKEGQHVKITVGDAEIEIPAIEAPGHVSNSITLPLGYGQKSVGVVGSGRGVDAYVLRKQPGSFVLSGAKVEALATVSELAITQSQNTMEGRAVYREGTLDTFNSDTAFAQKTGMDSHIPENISFYKGQVGKRSEDNPDGFDYETKHQWGMVIDLSKCIGCTACIVACQSENNIPVVGKDQVRKGRVMQWIRMDRYFAVPKWGKNEVEQESTWAEDNATPEQLENAEMVHQPMACQQCEAAPCETVCPVNATVHTDDGLNAMAYNRCIGTRYCANNCPYTARRFNWFDYNKRNPLVDKSVLGLVTVNNLYAGPLGDKKEDESLRLQRNPNVTVRMRGVIEKCTYCVQRIETAKILQKQIQRDSKNFRVPTDSVKTACQQSCPAEAIVFGDLADRNSAIVQIKGYEDLKDPTKSIPESPRNYQVLKYIGTRPRTSYLARLRNPNKKMPNWEAIAAWSNNQF